MATLILSIHKFNIDNYFTLDEYYNQDRQAYVDALKSADKNHDLTNWLEYFCQGVLYSIDKVKSEVLKLDQITSKYDNTIELTPNEISVLTLLEEKKHIQNKDIPSHFLMLHETVYNFMHVFHFTQSHKNKEVHLTNSLRVADEPQYCKYCSAVNIEHEGF